MTRNGIKLEQALRIGLGRKNQIGIKFCFTELSISCQHQNSLREKIFFQIKDQNRNSDLSFTPSNEAVENILLYK